MSTDYVRTDTYLDRILAHKADLIAQQMKTMPLAEMRQRAEATSASERDFSAALRRDTVALIAEAKKASPSKGLLSPDFDPARIGRLYRENGAAAISVLTEERFFQGSLENMALVNQGDDVQVCPVLRKDFIIAPYQIYETRASGAADALLLIVAALDDAQLRDLYDLSSELGLSALVEVHNETELERALALGASIIGVNNRNLKNFDVDVETTARLAPLVPEATTLVAESGIMSAGDVRRMGELGAHAVLVGEALVKSGQPELMVAAFSTQPRVTREGDE